MKVVAMLLVVVGMLFSAQGKAGIDSKAEMRDGTIICKDSKLKDAGELQRTERKGEFDRAADAR